MDMSAFAKYISIVFMAFLLSLSAAGQQTKKEELRSRKVQLQDEIELANKILEEARQSRQATVTSLQTINQKLRIREELLRTIDREIELIEEEIQEQENHIQSLRNEIDTLKAEYAEMIRQAYKSKSETGRLMFVLSSQNFAQAVRRVQYLRQYSSYRQQQVAAIEERQAELEHEIDMLSRQKEEKEGLRGQKESERNAILAERQEQQRAILDLQETEGSLESQISSKQAEANRLEEEIQKIIAEEIRKERARAERKSLEDRALAAGLVKGTDFNDRTNNSRLETLIAEARARATTPTPEPEPATSSFAMTPDVARLARNFEANKGNLPWPVERGIIVGRFGRQPHPANPSIKINNPHIEIGTQAGSEARAAFDGVVIRVIRVPGSPFTVIIQHGNYYTHYGNLGEVYVKEGEQVTARQNLGKIYTDPVDNQTVLQFGLWQNDQLEDPSPWLSR